jgi:hypothetical protein
MYAFHPATTQHTISATHNPPKSPYTQISTTARTQFYTGPEIDNQARYSGPQYKITVALPQHIPHINFSRLQTTLDDLQKMQKHIPINLLSGDQQPLNPQSRLSSHQQGNTQHNKDRADYAQPCKIQKNTIDTPSLHDKQKRNLMVNTIAMSNNLYAPSNTPILPLTQLQSKTVSVKK